MNHETPMAQGPVDVIVGRDDGMHEIRIAWSIGNARGNGRWFPQTARRALERTTEDGNVRYGLGTHWIETRRA